jgi:hypothetical protein
MYSDIREWKTKKINYWEISEWAKIGKRGNFPRYQPGNYANG